MVVHNQLTTYPHELSSTTIDKDIFMHSVWADCTDYTDKMTTDNTSLLIRHVVCRILNAILQLCALWTGKIFTK